MRGVNNKKEPPTKEPDTKKNHSTNGAKEKKKHPTKRDDDKTKHSASVDNGKKKHPTGGGGDNKKKHSSGADDKKSTRQLEPTTRRRRSIRRTEMTTRKITLQDQSIPSVDHGHQMTKTHIRNQWKATQKGPHGKPMMTSTPQTRGNQAQRQINAGLAMEQARQAYDARSVRIKRNVPASRTAKIKR